MSLFIAAEPDLLSRVVIRNYARDIGLKNLIPSKDLHATIFYSLNMPSVPYPKIPGFFNETAKCYQVCYIGNAIALLLYSPFLRERNTIAIACGLRSKFSSIIPHLSLCYDPPMNINLSKLPQPDFTINFNSEIVKPGKKQ